MVFKVFWSPRESAVPHNSEKVLRKVCECKELYFLIDKQTEGGWMVEDPVAGGRVAVSLSPP